MVGPRDLGKWHAWFLVKGEEDQPEPFPECGLTGTGRHTANVDNNGLRDELAYEDVIQPP
jgi:hypothetical protein